MKSISIVLFGVFLMPFSSFLFGQIDSTNYDLPDINQDILENVLQNAEEDFDFDFNTAFEALEIYLNKPLNLNKVEEEDLVTLGLLSDIQIYNFLKYRKEVGDLIAIYELQAIPEFDLESIQRILPYVSVSGDVDDYRVPLGQMFKEGSNEFFMRWSRILQTQKGYTPLEEGQTTSR